MNELTCILGAAAVFGLFISILALSWFINSGNPTEVHVTRSGNGGSQEEYTRGGRY